MGRGSRCFYDLRFVYTCVEKTHFKDISTVIHVALFVPLNRR